VCYSHIFETPTDGSYWPVSEVQRAPSDGRCRMKTGQQSGFKYQKAESRDRQASPWIAGCRGPQFSAKTNR